MARALVLLLVVALWPALMHADSTAGDYQTPDFDAKLFDRDALSLEGEELANVVDALTAVVRNFDSVANIDSDVKEKALALALRLQPLNPAARAAHLLMSGGQGPSVGLESILRYSDTGKIFQVLAVNGERLLRERAQPDDEILGPLLMEIGLTILSPLEWEGPEAQKVAHAYNEVGGKGELEGFWKLTVRQQPIPGDGASLLASRLAKLQPLAEVETADDSSDVNSSAQTQKMATESTSAADLPGAFAANSSDTVRTGSLDTSVMFLADVLGAGGASLADASIEIVDLDPDADESGAESTLVMRLVRVGPANSALRGVTGGRAWVNQTFPRWPDGKQAVVRLLLGSEDKESVVSAPGERWPVEVSLPLALVMYSTLSKAQIAADVAISGRIEAGGSVKPVLPRSEILREVGENVGRIAVLAVPLDEVVESRELASPAEIEVLGRVQVIEVGTFDELQQVAVSELRPAELSAAMAEFAEVQRVGIRPGNLSDPELRGKLAAVVQQWPGHYSAQRLLAASSADGLLSTGASASAPQTAEDEIDQLLAPLLGRYAADRDPNAVTELGGLDDLIAEAEIHLRGLSINLPTATDSYHILASALVVSLGDYLNLNNRGNDSSNAEKHRQVIDQQLTELEKLRQAADRQ